MDNSNKTKITAEEGKQELFIVREFDASREKVFKAFSTPELLMEFFAPFGNKMRFNYHNYQTGGSYSWYNEDQKGNVLCTFNGIIHEIEAPIRLIQTSEFMELPERGHVVLEKMLFEELPNGRTKLIIHDVCFSVADRNAMIDSGMEKGLIEIFNNLDHLIRNSKL
jgi:uncharacterized protein YndB with AHSA1/START domain